MAASYCGNCGARHAPEDTFCAECGSSLVAEAAPESRPPASDPARAPPVAARGGKTVALILVSGLAVMALIVGLIVGLREPATDTTGPPAGEQALDARTLTRDEHLVDATLGPPTLFRMMAPEPTSDGHVALIHETWTYPELGTSITFYNGEYVGSDDIPSVPEGANHSELAPTDVRSGMTLEHLSGTLGEEGVVLDPPLLPAWEFVAFPGVIAGFWQGGLSFIETSPYEDADSGQALAFAGSRSVPIQLTSFHRSDALLASAAAAPVVQRVLFQLLTGATVLTAIVIAGTVVRLRNLGNDPVTTVQSEINGAISFLNEQKGNLSGPALSQVTQDIAYLNNLKGDITFLEKLKAMVRAVDPTGITHGPAGITPDLTIQQQFNKFIEDRGGRPGDITNSLKAFLNALTGDWTKVPPAIRETLLTDLIKTKINEACGPAPTGDSEALALWENCAKKKLRNIRDELPSDAPYLDPCLDIIEQILSGSRGLPLVGAGLGGPLPAPPLTALLAQVDENENACPGRGGVGERPPDDILGGPPEDIPPAEPGDDEELPPTPASPPAAEEIPFTSGQAHVDFQSPEAGYASSFDAPLNTSPYGSPAFTPGGPSRVVFYTQSTPAEELWLEGEFRVGTVSDLEVVVQTFENAGENPYTNHYAGATCSVTFSRADEASGIEGTFSCTGLKSSDDSETLNATGSFSATF